MKQLFLILSFLLSFTVLSQIYAQQEWAPDSAVWNHGYFTTLSWTPPFIYDSNNLETRVWGDSLYQGKSCRVLVRTLNYAGGGSTAFDTLFTYQDSFKVYFWNEYHNHFSLLFDFNVQVGDTVRLEGTDSICYQGIDWNIVDSVGSFTLNSDTLRYYVLRNTSGTAWVQGGRNIEKIGNTEQFLPIWGCFFDTGYSEFGLYCYQDPQLGLYSTGMAPSCDYILLGTEKEFSKSNSKIFNLESEWMLESRMNERFTEIHVFNLAGKQESEIIQNPSPQISIPKYNLPSGLYVFQARLDSGKWVSGKLLKE